MIIALNIMFATIVIVAIVGMLAWSVARDARDNNLDAPAGILRSARRRQRTTARAHIIGRSVENRA
jgi:hypothetical protein